MVKEKHKLEQKDPNICATIWVSEVSIYLLSVSAISNCRCICATIWISEVSIYLLSVSAISSCLCGKHSMTFPDKKSLISLSFFRLQADRNVLARLTKAATEALDLKVQHYHRWCLD